MTKLIGKQRQAARAKAPKADDTRHISKLDPTSRARANQTIQHALLAIVVQQGKPVTIPMEALDATASSHRLKIEIEDGIATFTAEKASLIIEH